MKVDITGFDELFKKLDDFEKTHFSLAVSRAISKTAYDVKDGLVGEMKRVFDRPTPYTLNSLYVRQAKVNDLSAFIYPKEAWDKGTSAKKYLYPNIAGGDRHVKRFERALQAMGILPTGMYVTPGPGAQLDAYGNISRGQIMQILSYFGAAEMTLGYSANITAKRKAKLAKGTKRMQGFVYFIANGKGVKSNHLPMGIYRRSAGAWASWGSPLKLVLLFSRKPSYKAIFHFFDLGKKITNDMFPKNFEESMDAALHHAKL